MSISTEEKTIDQALDLELSFLEILLKKSRAQHGNTGYHRKMSQTLSFLRKNQLSSICQVVQMMEFKCRKLESDLQRSFPSSNTKIMREEQWCIASTSATTEVSMAVLSAPVNKECALGDQIAWLFQLHKGGKYQEFTSRMHTTVHSIFLETSRGFFLPLLSVATAALSRVHSIIMTFARQSIIAMLQVRDKLQPIINNITEKNHVTIPQNIARDLGKQFASFRQFQYFMQITCGRLSYEADVPCYMNATAEQYDCYLARASPFAMNMVKQKLSKHNEETILPKIDDANAQKSVIGDYPDTCRSSNEEEDTGESVHNEHRRADERESPSLFHQTDRKISLNATDLRQLDDANSVILSTLLPKKRKKTKAVAPSEGSHSTQPKKQKKSSSRHSSSVIDEIFSAHLPVSSSSKKRKKSKKAVPQAKLD